MSADHPTPREIWQSLSFSQALSLPTVLFTASASLVTAFLVLVTLAFWWASEGEGVTS